MKKLNVWAGIVLLFVLSGRTSATSWPQTSRDPRLMAGNSCRWGVLSYTATPIMALQPTQPTNHRMCDCVCVGTWDLVPWMKLIAHSDTFLRFQLTLRLLMSYIYGAPSKARNANVYIWTYVWQRWNSLFLFTAQCFNTESMQRGFLCHICV